MSEDGRDRRGGPNDPTTPGPGAPRGAATPAEDTATYRRPGPDGQALRPRLGLVARDAERYEVLGEQGRGGIGQVLRAQDKDLDRVVALKELLATSPAAQLRFVREVRLTARLEHPGIVPVHDAGVWTSNGRSFYTMKLVGGASLKEVVERAKSADERLALTPHLLAISEAMAYAHDRAIIHRDLKPSNVIVGEYGETVVIDWGLAKEVGEPDLPLEPEVAAAPSVARRRLSELNDLTVAGTVLGTPAFMAPEQARGEPADARSDVYALGAIGYFILTGIAPYEGSTSEDVVSRVIAEPPPPLRKRARRTPVDLIAILEKAMARDPLQRYPSARELVQDLRRYQMGRLVLAREYAFWEPPLRWLRKHWLISSLSALFLAAAATGLSFSVRQEHRLRAAADAQRDLAELQTRSLLEVQARRELDTGRPHRAAVLLASALRGDPSNGVLRNLLSQALRPIQTKVRSLLGHERDVVTVAFSPDGQRLASGSTDLTIRIWRVETGVEERVIRGHTRSLEEVAWSPDGSLLAGGEGNEVRIWRVADGQLVHAFKAGATTLGFSRDGTQLWAGGFQGHLWAWEVATGKELYASKPHDDRVSALAFHPDGKRVFASSWDGRLSEWSVEARKLLRRFDDQKAPLRFVTVRGDGRFVLSGDEEGGMALRDGQSLQPLDMLRLPGAFHATSGGFGPEGIVYSAGGDGVLRVWHATGGRALRAIDTIPHGRLFDSAVSPDGQMVATASLRSIELWRPLAAADFRLLDGAEPLTSVYHPGNLSSDGRRLVAPRVVRDAPASMRVWDTATGAIVASWKEEGLPYSLAISSDGSWVALTDLSRPVARIREVATGRLVAELKGHEKTVYNLAKSPDDALLATSSYDKTVRLWNARDGSPVGPVMSVDARATAVAFDPVQPRLAVAVEDGTVWLFDRSTGVRQRRFKAHATWIQDVEFSRDGTHLVTAGRQDMTVKVWDLSTETAPPVVLSGHTDNVIRASFRSDGAVVATTSMDDTARLWDARTGALLRILPGANETAEFSPDGRTLYTTGMGDYAVAWSLEEDARSSTTLADVAEVASPWRLVDGRLTLPPALGP